MCEVDAHFPSRFAPIILANHVYGGNIIGANQVGKCALTSHSSISVTDRIKTNEQNKSILTGPLYKRTELEAI